MTSFLIKRFIRNYENYKDRNVRERYGIFVSIIGIVCNALFFAVKLFAGFIMGSVSIMADAFNNLSDSGSSIVTLVGFKLGNKPPDREHPFGHGRIEYLAGLFVGIVIILVGYEFLRNSVEKIMNPQPMQEFSIVLIALLLFTMLGKLWLAWINKNIGKRINSKALFATSQDAMNDVLFTGVTVVSVLVTKYTGFLIDGYAGALVALVLIKSGWEVAKDTLSTLIGERASAETVSEIKAIAEKKGNIVGIHDLILHNYGPNLVMGTIHAEAPANLSFEKSHEIADSIEQEVLKKLGVYIVVHIDPVSVGDLRIKTLSEIVDKTIKNIDVRMSTHDFRLVESVGCTNFVFDFIFDIEVPHETNEETKRNLVKEIKTAVADFDKAYNCVINLECSYIEN